MKKMKKINKTLTGMVLLVIVFSLNSCLKNGKYYTDFAAVGPSVDLPLSAADNLGLETYAFSSTETSASIPFYINLASPKPLGTAVTATLALDTAFFNSFNAANGGIYSILPDSVYTVINGWNRTIPAGQRLDSMYVKIDFTKMDLTQAYILPVTIQSASVPIEQWNHLLVNPSVKNQYDGTYNMVGSALRSGDPVKTGEFAPITMDLQTSGPSSVTFATLQPWADGTGIGIGNPVLTVNSDNSVTITSSGGASNAPGYNSHYNPDTQTFYISFTWGGGPTSRLATDTLTHQ